MKVKLENASKSAHDGQASSVPIRPWKVIAEEASHEQDPVKLSRLVQELNEAIDAQGVSKPKKNAGENR